MARSNAIRARDYFTAEQLAAAPPELRALAEAAEWHVEVKGTAGPAKDGLVPFCVRQVPNAAARELERLTETSKTGQG